jgi:integrase
MIVGKKDLTSSLKIKNNNVLERGNDIISKLRKKIEGLYLEVNDVPFDTIVEKLKQKDEGESINFIKYAERWVNEHNDLKGIRNYKSAINALCKFFGRRVIYCSEFCEQMMREWERSLSDKPRAMSLYTSSIMKIFQDAREFYNDYDNDDIKIKKTLHSYKPKKQNVAEKRALTVEQIRAIYNYTGKSEREIIARDCFIISFCLMGMNAVDLYSVTDYDGQRIRYNRTKTRDRRSDNALMEIIVPENIKPIMKKYVSKGNAGTVFNFSERYSTPSNFNVALNKGLKIIGNALGIEKLQFYSARHSMATIAANDVRIPLYIVNDMLCHIDERMRVTNLYIKKDFSLINEANEKLMDYVFNQK